MLLLKTDCSGNPHFPGRKHGKINCGYDDVGERNRRRTAHQKKFLRNLEKHFPGNTYVMYGHIPLSGMYQPVFYGGEKII